MAQLAVDLASIPDLDALQEHQVSELEARFLRLAGPSIRTALKDHAPLEAALEFTQWDELVASVASFISGFDPEELGILDEPGTLHEERWPFHQLSSGVPGIGRRLMLGNWDVLTRAWQTHVHRIGPTEAIDWTATRIAGAANPWLKARRALSERFRSLGKQRSAEIFAFGGFHQEARELLYWIQNGGRLGMGVELPDHYRSHLALSLVDGSIEHELRERPFRLTEPILYEVVLARPFAFGLCHRCDRVFIRASRGRRAEFCSRLCKDAAAPSAAKRPEYMRAYRKRRLEQDLTRAKRILERVGRSDPYAALNREWPGQRRHINGLLRRLNLAPKQRRGSAP